MGRGSCWLKSVNFEAQVAQHLASLLLERLVFLRVFSQELARECKAFPIDKVRW